MAATRQTPGFQIYQDMSNSQSILHNAVKPRPQLQPSAMPLQPVRNTQPYQNAPMHPPSTAPPHMSPLKSQHLSPHMQQYPQLTYMPVPPPSHGNLFTDSPIKHNGMSMGQQYQPAPLPAQPMFGTFNSNLEAFPQENFHIMSSQAEAADFPIPSYPRRQPLKRSLSDATMSGDRPVKRFRQDEDVPAQLLDPKDMPPVDDDGLKPGYSYAQMIGMAILRAPNRRLTLSQIYDWISNTFTFYRDDPKQGWHNSIRHNLSLNKAFKKQERPKGDAGKGSYWMIEPGMEAQFCKDRSRKAANMTGMTAYHSGIHTQQIMAQPLAEAMTPSWSISVPATIPPRPQTAPALPELSSDATLPASDPALHDEEGTDAILPSNQPPSSPVPIINSSPPVVTSNHHRTLSSPVNTRPPSNRQHKRNATAVHDSGYFSELPSSVRRPKMNNNTIIPSDIHTDTIHSDRLTKKRGRAEEEILRMRSSPQATPKPRRLSMATTTTSDFGLSSSPIRPSPSIQLNPATPAVRFKKPYIKAPPSLSPNTQLQQHRLMMQDFTGSPIKSAGLPSDSFPDYSPQFKMPGSVYRSRVEEEFLIFEDNFKMPVTPGNNSYLMSSPLKSVRRQGFTRSHTSAGILRDVTNTSNGRSNNNFNMRTTPSKVPNLKPTSFKPMTYTGSPLKKSMVRDTHIEVENTSSLDINGELVKGEFDDGWNETGFDETTFVKFDDHDDESTLIEEVVHQIDKCVNDSQDRSSDTAEDGDDNDQGFDLAKGFVNIGQSNGGIGNGGGDFLVKKHIQRPSLGARSFTSAF